MRLYRACSREEAYWTLELLGVGGASPNKEIGCPTTQDAIEYVGMHEGSVLEYIKISESELLKTPNEPDGTRTLSEFTSNLEIAKRFAKSTGYIIAVDIEPEFLTKGSKLEDGWIAKVSAPIKQAEYVMINGDLQPKYIKTKSETSGKNRWLEQDLTSENTEEVMQPLTSEDVSRNLTKFEL